jgi:hypothetical protein
MPKTDIALHLLVMIRTFSAKLRDLGRSLIGVSARAVVRVCGGVRVARGSLASEAGDTLIEVLISALLVGLIVVATLTGFNVTAGASASERARAQADALAQQAEERLRSLPLARLEALQVEPIKEEITQNGAKYTIVSTAEYHIEEGTSSCNSSSTNAGYYRTSSTVTGPWQSAKSPVVETGIISPPPGSALLIQVVNNAGEGAGGMTVTATGPTPESTVHTLTTTSNGCAVFAVKPGEYTINVSRAGYVDQNWYKESKEDPHTVHSVYLTAESSAKEEYRFDRAGTLEVEFETESENLGGDSFTAVNSQMATPAFRAIPSPSTPETYATKIVSPAEVFPFTGKNEYSVYAGTCEANNPVEVNAKNTPAPTVSVSGGTGKVTVPEPPINIRVMSGTKAGAEEGVPVEHASATLQEREKAEGEKPEGEGCKVTRELKTTTKGVLSHPGMPYGEYKLCVTGGNAGGVNKEKSPEKTGLAKDRKYTTAIFENDDSGPNEPEKLTNGGVKEIEGKKYAVIYLGAGALGSMGGETCP